MRRWLDKIGKLQRLSARERNTLLLAGALLPVVSLSIRFAGLNATKRWLGRLAGNAGERRAAATDDFPASAARLVAVAALHHPYKAVCLAQSMTLWFLLARQGIDSVVRIGVTRDSGVFSAHAWVDMNGTVLLDQPDVSDRFSIIA
jgi:hypothetical protein